MYLLPCPDLFHWACARFPSCFEQNCPWFKGSSLTPEVMSPFNDRLIWGSKPCLTGRHIQLQLLFQNSLGVTLKLFSLLTFLPLPYPASLTSGDPVCTYFGLSISVLSLNVLDCPLIFKREPLKYQFCLCKFGWILTREWTFFGLYDIYVFSIWPPFL